MVRLTQSIDFCSRNLLIIASEYVCSQLVLLNLNMLQTEFHEEIMLLVAALLAFLRKPYELLLWQAWMCARMSVAVKDWNHSGLLLSLTPMCNHDPSTSCVCRGRTPAGPAQRPRGHRSSEEEIEGIKEETFRGNWRESWEGKPPHWVQGWVGSQGSACAPKPFHMGAPQQLGLLFWKWKGNNPGALLVWTPKLYSH